MIRRAAPGAGWPLFGRDAEGVAWRPDPAAAEAARLARFLRATGEPSLDALQARAVVDPGWFWGAAADDLGLAWGRPPTTIVDLSGGPAWARWWTGGSFDWSWAAVEPRAAADPDGTAITWEGEDGDVRSLTNRELARAVRRAAARLAGLGVGPGDRVGILLPMLLETAVAVLAVSRLGAIFTPIFSGYAAPAIATRLVDAAATRPHHGRRIPAPRRLGRPQVRGRRRGRGGAVGPARAGRPPGRRRARRRRGRTAGTRGGPGTTPTPTAGRTGAPTAGIGGAPERDPETPVHGHLHVGHDRPAQGRGPRPRRLPDQGRPGPRPHVRPDEPATRCSGSPTSAG